MKQKEKGSALIAVTIVVLIILIAGGYYFYTKNKSGISESSTSPAVVAPIVSPQSSDTQNLPAIVVTLMLTDARAVTTADEAEKVLMKYFTQSTIEKTQSVEKSPQLKNFLLNSYKSMPDPVTLSARSVKSTESAATITYAIESGTSTSSSSQNNYFVVNLLKEADQWKIDTVTFLTK